MTLYVERGLERKRRGKDRILRTILAYAAVALVLFVVYAVIAHEANAAQFPLSYSGVVKGGTLYTPKEFCSHEV
jgi:hypothetical protein